jgi:hypothetical protein
MNRGIEILMRRPNVLAFELLLIGLVAGCGDGGLPVVPVNGKVTFAGGPPPKPGTITFTPIRPAEGMPSRPATANFDANGNFHVTSFKEHDGLVPGTYHACIDCWMRPPTLTNPITFETYNYVPKNFEPPPIAVDPDANVIEVVIDVPKKKMT